MGQRGFWRTVEVQCHRCETSSIESALEALLEFRTLVLPIPIIITSLISRTGNLAGIEPDMPVTLLCREYPSIQTLFDGVGDLP